MKRKLLFGLMTIIMAVSLAGCGSAGQKPGGSADDSSAGTIKGDVDNDLCKYFTADFIYSATGKPVVRVEPSKLAGVFSCDYFFDYKEDFYKDSASKIVMPGGPHVTIVLDNLNVEKQKEGLKLLDAGIETDPRIKMEHYIVRRTKDKSIWEVALVINPNRFVWADYEAKALTDDQLIELGAKMADLIQGRKIEIKSNPVQLTEDKPADLGGSQQAVALQFMGFLASGKAADALSMMDASDQTKQMWLTNFQSIKSLKVKKTEEAFKEEWTPERQVFKFILDVSVTPAGEQIGWENGTNFRWVTLQKTGGKWLVHELANNP